MSWIRRLFSRKRLENDLDKELHFHFESQVTDKVRSGISESEARRLIAQGGVRLNDAPVQTATATITDADLDQNGTARLSVGKKRHGLIRRA